MIRFGLTGGVVLACGLLVGTAFGRSSDASGLATLNTGGVDSISCAKAGDCVAGGWYAQRSLVQAFVVSRRNGKWGTPIRVPGTAPLSANTGSEVTSVSCPAVGNCSAGGYRMQHGVVVTERNGIWGKAIVVTAKLNVSGGDAKVTSISCAAVGKCAAAGYYPGPAPWYDIRAFVVSETSGHWGKAIEVPGTFRITGGVSLAHVDSISCPVAGECAAFGGYQKQDHGGGGADAGGTFVVSETHGRWRKATKLPGTATLNADGVYGQALSCPAAGDCTIGGFYTQGSDAEAFEVSKTNGVWGKAITVPGTATLNVGGSAQVTSVSCAAVADCAAGGYYLDGSGNEQVFVVDETNGIWGAAIEVPGTAALNTGSGNTCCGYDADVDAISCGAPGDCTAGGHYNDESGHHQAFVVTETNGTWGAAIEVPGTAQFNTGGLADVSSISCVAAGECSAGGAWSTRPSLDFLLHPFVIGETSGSWGDATNLRNFRASCFVPNLVGQTISVAKKRLGIWECRVGRITKKYSTMRKGLVVAQRPKRDKVLRGEARVSFVVSKGKQR